MAHLGFIGLGAMGSVMARRLLEAGHELTVWNRSPGAVDALRSFGVRRASSPHEALEPGVTLSMLADDRALDDVFSGEILKAAAGGIHVNMATVGVRTARALSRRHLEAGVGYIAAPVLGRPPLAAAGQLNVVAAGRDSDIDAAAPFLSVLSKRVWRVGAQPELANVVKIAVNLNLIHTLQALAESVTIVERGGVSGETFVEILTDAAYTGTAYAGYGPMIARRSYEPAAFSVALGLKDLRLAEEAAAETFTVLPTGDVLRSLFEAALADDELAALDWSAVAEVTRRLVPDN